MAEFVFTAPSLFDAAATTDCLPFVFHDSPEETVLLAKQRRLAFWLAAEMESRGLETGEPEMDEGGWMLTVPSENGFILCVLGLDGGEDAPFSLAVAKIGESKKDYPRVVAALEAILREAAEVSDVRVDRD